MKTLILSVLLLSTTQAFAVTDAFSKKCEELNGTSMTRSSCVIELQVQHLSEKVAPGSFDSEEAEVKRTMSKACKKSAGKLSASMDAGSNYADGILTLDLFCAVSGQ